LSLGLLGFRSLHLESVDDLTQKEFLDHLADDGDRLRLSVLERFDSVSDLPVCATFEALDAAYPGSKFILTTREKQPWLASCRVLWSKLEPYLRERPEEPYARFLTALCDRLYGTSSFDAAAFARAYDAYHERVRVHFRERPGIC
jgi:sulfotransferase family protein